MGRYLNNKQEAAYQQYLKDTESGRLLTPDGLRFICEACDYDAEKIGKVMLENLAKFQSKPD